MIELQQIIALKRELPGRETCSRSPINYSEGMADDQKDHFIQYLAERVIRKMTIQRNNSLHYGSDEGAKMAVTYHSVISTVNLHDGSAWEYIGTFFKNIFNGCRDYVNWVPGRIALATCQR